LISALSEGFVDGFELRKQMLPSFRRTGLVAGICLHSADFLQQGTAEHGCGAAALVRALGVHSVDRGLDCLVLAGRRILDPSPARVARAAEGARPVAKRLGGQGLGRVADRIVVGAAISPGRARLGALAKLPPVVAAAATVRGARR